MSQDKVKELDKYQNKTFESIKEIENSEKNLMN